MPADTTPAELLHRAEQVLGGQVAAGGGNAARLAAVLARQALEMIVQSRCSAFGSGIDRASMRSKLVMLKAFDDASVADDAASAWHGLSAACHRHAFELSPTVGETRSQCETVARLL